MSKGALASKDFWSGLIFIALAAAALALRGDLPVGTSTRMGPGYFPTALAILLGIIGAALVVRALISPGPPVERLTVGKPALIVGSVVLFGLLLYPLGLVGSMVILILISAFASQNFRWKTASVLAIALTLGSTIIFIWLLGLPLPLRGTWLGG